MVKGKNKVKHFLYISLFVLVILFCNGCKKGDTKENTNLTEENKKIENVDNSSTLTSDSVVMTIGDIPVTYEEVLFYIFQLKGQYEPSLGEEVWEYEYLEGKTFGDYAKEEIIRHLTELNVINQQARSQGIDLSEDEIEEIKELVADYMENVDQESAEKYGITSELVEKVYGDNLLANKMFDITTGEVDTSIPDEEARQVTIDYLVVLTKGTTKDGIKVDFSEKEKKEALARAKELRKEAKSAENFYLFAEANSDVQTVRVTYGEDNKPDGFGEKGFEMETGKLSGVITGKDGYYIIYSESDFNEEATMQKKEDMISERQSQVFEKAYTEWSKNYEVVVGSKLWEQIQF